MQAFLPPPCRIVTTVCLWEMCCGSSLSSALTEIDQSGASNGMGGGYVLYAVWQRTLRNSIGNSKIVELGMCARREKILDPPLTGRPSAETFDWGLDLRLFGLA